MRENCVVTSANEVLTQELKRYSTSIDDIHPNQLKVPTQTNRPQKLSKQTRTRKPQKVQTTAKIPDTGINERQQNQEVLPNQYLPQKRMPRKVRTTRNLKNKLRGHEIISVEVVNVCLSNNLN